MNLDQQIKYVRDECLDWSEDVATGGGTGPDAIETLMASPSLQRACQKADTYAAILRTLQALRENRPLVAQDQPPLVAPERVGMGTGILVKARGPDGNIGNHDIAELTRESLLRWLRSRGGANLWAENVVMQLLAHEEFTAEQLDALTGSVDATGS